MYYRKYFSGSVDATTITNQYYMGLDKIATGTSKGNSLLKNRTDVIGNALVSTLKDVGFTNAFWDSTSGYLFFDKTNSLCGIYILVTSNTWYLNVGFVDSSHNYVNSDSTTSSSIYGRSAYTNASNSPFQNQGTGVSNYAFYVTIKGEPQGIFSVSIGCYDNHSAETNYFYVCNCTDKRDNSKIIGFNFGSTLNAFTVNKFTDAYRIRPDYYNGTITFGTKTDVLTLNNETVVLIPMFLEFGYYILDNTYLNPGISTVGFYEIDDDIYFISTYYITKCITEV